MADEVLYLIKHRVRSFTKMSANFTVPAGVTSLTIFHLIAANGTLNLDDASLTSQGAPPPGIFTTTGAVTFRFDDAQLDQYQNAAPMLDSAGFKGEFYIITQQLADYGFTNSMSIAQVKDLFARGQELGAHAPTHQKPTTLTAQQEQTEIVGSRQDLMGWGVGKVNSFAYPYGKYNSTPIQAVKNSGFTNAAAAITGYVTPASDP